MTQVTSLHRKYRPQTLKRIIGHDQVVTRLKGMVASGNYPNAIMFSGATSAGKTTLARALAAEINGVDSFDKLGNDYMEINCSEKRTIDDVRSIIEKSKYKPSKTRRIIVLDEVQGLVSNAQAAAALLKPLEEPTRSTLWILCTMDPSKFTTGNGRAIANRCTQFVLEKQDKKALTRQAKRILKAEKMGYARDLIEQIVEYSAGEMRSLANIIEGVQQYYEGLDKKPKRLKEEAVSSVLRGSITRDEELVVPVLTGIYSGKFAQAQAALLDVTDGVRFINLLLQGNAFLMNLQVVGKHPKIWWTPVHRELNNAIKPIRKHCTLGALAATNENLVKAKALINNFTVTAEEALSSCIYRTIKDIFTKD